ncbi:huntingtin-interacting protein 1-like [Oscarella lobularis]|uniref:huntingtin-interacting protein 1-like n=1 Tax=Oscarella lobularis TaxID=121494 RepID=UPI0033136C91
MASRGRSSSSSLPESGAGILDYEKFEKEQIEALSKAVSNQESPAKGKHIRTLVIGTFHERGCSVFWTLLRGRFQLDKHNFTCWKAAMTIHKVLRDGHETVLPQSYRHLDWLKKLSDTWGTFLDAYSKLISSYLGVVCAKLVFHHKNPDFPSNLQFKEKPITVENNDINAYFELAVEVFDFQATIIRLQKIIFASLDPSKGAHAQAVQSRIAPLVPLIEDSGALYDMAFKLMRKLHSSLPSDTLAGHRDRFYKQFDELQRFYFSASSLQYLETLVTVPTLPGKRPDFLSTVKKQESPQTKRKSMPELQRKDTDQRFRDAFGSPTKMQAFNFGVAQAASEKELKEKDRLIEQLMREVVELRQKVMNLDGRHMADMELLGSLRTQLAKLEEEMAEYKDIAAQALDENVFLKSQLEGTKTAEEIQSEAQSKMKMLQEKFGKMKQMYGSLRNEHVDLLKKNAQTNNKIIAFQKSIDETQDENSSLKNQLAQLENNLDDMRATAAEAEQVPILQAALAEQQKATESLYSEKEEASLQMKENYERERHSFLVRSIEEAQKTIEYARQHSSGDEMSGNTSSAHFLLSEIDTGESQTTRLEDAADSYFKNHDDVASASVAVNSFGHAISDLILYCRSTANRAPDDPSEEILREKEVCSERAVAVLDALKMLNTDVEPLKGKSVDLRSSFDSLKRLAKLLIPKEDEDSPENVGDVVEQEMAATTKAIEAAAARIEEMLNQSRAADAGIKLEVNGRILDASKELMKCIKILIEKSKHLQREIVGEGRDSAGAKDFYKRNHRWTEGLISAAKAVGWGASLLVDSADKVVLGSGKFEELIVASHEVAASTAQLVAASRVKASRHSDRLAQLKVASKAVTEATAGVVASSKSGSKMTEEASASDYSSLSLTQTKRLEMDSQVRVLELESMLEKERSKLSELRRAHYHLAGASEGWEEDAPQSPKN